MTHEFSPLLAAYRSLESATHALDELEAYQMEDCVRNVMATIWKRLSLADREQINSRTEHAKADATVR
jgi:hypothetical protein